MQKDRLPPIAMAHICMGERKCLNLHHALLFRIYHPRLTGMISYNPYNYRVR